MTARDDRLRERLQAAGARLETADAERAKAIAALGKAVRAGQARLSVSELARLTGVTRVTIYAMLKED